MACVRTMEKVKPKIVTFNLKQTNVIPVRSETGILLKWK